MKIFGIDPGAVYTGVALSHYGDTFAKQFDNPVTVYGAVAEALDYHPQDNVILIEGYISAGVLTKEAKATIELVGAFKWLFTIHHAFETQVIIRPPQARLSGRREAAELMGGTIEQLESDPNRKDAFSALAHCCSYRRSL